MRRHSSRRHASSSEVEDRESKRKATRKETKTSTSTTEVTNLLEFTFLDHKPDLNRVLLGYSARDQLVENGPDFWLFLGKYEGLLKKSGNCFLPTPQEEMPSGFPEDFHKTYLNNMRFSVPLDELLGRLGSTRHSKLTSLKVRQFLQIVLHYLDFKQKEKFSKLKKLRASQANLPVAKYKTEIIEAVKNESVVLLAGDTGCGKSTQIPQYLSGAGYKNIACTQPRRIACISLSKRVAHEMLCEYGTAVGYQIRFERSKNKDTSICFITEGLLLRQLSQETMLSQYDVLVLDEIHERHLHGDFLLGVAKCLIKARPDLKLILMSATINISLFSEYFKEEQARIIEVPGRLYPIKLFYKPQFKDAPSSSGKSERLSPEPYIQILQLIDQKYPPTERGDLLIFMSGLNEITTVVDAAKDYASAKNNWIILPLHSSLSIADQDKVFDYAPDGKRKCIVSTNIAETSVTIDGIRFVVDSGKVKEMSYDPTCKLSRLKEFSISKASADQRKGRAGRTGPGVCYRLYAEKEYDQFDAYSTPEIHRVPLESLLLQMISMGLPNARLFPFIEPPPMEGIETSILSLKQQDALTADEKLTAIGKALSRLPVDISIGKMLLMGCVFSQLQPVLTMAAALSVQTPFTNRAYRDNECEAARKDLESDHGDPITLLNAYREWLDLKQLGFDRRHEVESTKVWCRRRGLEEQRFYEITKLRNQFKDLLTDCGLIEIADKKHNMSSAERAIRHGELRQLKELRKAHKMEAPRKRKLLASDGIDDETADDQRMDIRDVEFRLSHDSAKMKDLLSGATACSYRDLMTLKLILVSGLYPQVAISDEFNYCKSPMQQFYHTVSKPFTSLHPMGYFGNNTQILQLEDSDIIDKPFFYKSKQPLSAKHQILCYLTLLETNKPYLMNTLRMPAAQTLLLFAHAIDTNGNCSKVVCDSWLCLEFPHPESGIVLVQKACELRRAWNKLLAQKLEVLTQTVDSQLDKAKRDERCDRLEHDLWQNLANFMNAHVYYTISRLLPADLKSLYVGYAGSDEQDGDDCIVPDPNPFADDIGCQRNAIKGGWYVTENVTIKCVQETDWSVELERQFVENGFTCEYCQEKMHITALEKLQHIRVCAQVKREEESIKVEEKGDTAASPSKVAVPSSSRASSDCADCGKSLQHMSAIDRLRHKKTCTRIQ